MNMFSLSFTQKYSKLILDLSFRHPKIKKIKKKIFNHAYLKLKKG